MRIFISHSTKEDKDIDKIADFFEAEAFTTWVDHRRGTGDGLEVGSPSWDKAIREAISGCDIAFFVMSPNSLASDICQAEVLLVRELNKPLYILRLKEPKPEAVWLFIKMGQYADLLRDFAGGLQLLLRTIRGESLPDAPKALSGRMTGVEQMRIHLPYLGKVALVGREAEMQRVNQKLGSHILQILGVGGLGKSRLVAEIALQHPTGVIWHRCTENSQAYELLNLLRRHFELDDKTEREAALDYMKSHVAPLVIVDNGEAIAATDERRRAYIEMLQALVAYSAPLILTSRVAWGELRPRIEEDPNRLEPAAAAALLLDFSNANKKEISPEQAKALAEACLEHPRLLEWAAGQLIDRPYERILKLLREKKHEDVEGLLDEMLKQTLKDMESEEKHGKEAAELLRCLTVFRGSFDEAAVLAVKPDAMSEDLVLDSLLPLLKRWQFLRRSGESRYRIEEIVIQAIGTDESAHAKAFDHFNTLYGDYYANQTYAEDGTIPKHKEITPDWENLEAVLAWALAEDEKAKAAVDLLIALQYYMTLQKSSEARLLWLGNALTATQNMGYTLGEANTLKAFGNVCYLKNEYAEAIRYLERALPIFQVVGDKWRESTTLEDLGRVYLRKSEYAEAIRYLERALSLHQALGSRLNQANTLRSLGDVYIEKNELAEAARYLEQALPLYQSIGDRLGQANTLRSIGEVHRIKSEYAEAVRCLEQALPRFQALGDRLGQANTLRSIGEVHIMKNEYAEAVRYLEQALPLYQSIGDRLGQANTLRSIGEVHIMKNEYAEAIRYLEQALPLNQAIGERLGQANTLQSLGDVHLRKNEYAEAINYYEQALQLGEHIGEFSSRLNSLRGLALSYKAQENLEKACQYARQTLALADSHEYYRGHPIVQEWREAFARWGCEE